MKKNIYIVLNAVKHFFETAMHWEYARKNPAYTLQLPKISKRQKPNIEPIRIVEMIEGIESIREKAAIAIGFYGLLRIGETFGLTWPCIDFRNNLLSVERRIYKGEIGSPKSESSRDPIIMFEKLSRILKELKLQSTSQTWLFPGVRRKDRPSSHDAWEKNYFKPLLKECKLSMRYHDLRHLGIMFFREQGMAPDFIQRQARHASISTTFDVYSEIPEKQLKNEIGRIDDFLMRFTSKKTS